MSSKKKKQKKFKSQPAILLRKSASENRQWISTKGECKMTQERLNLIQERPLQWLIRDFRAKFACVIPKRFPTIHHHNLPTLGIYIKNLEHWKNNWN